MAVRAEPPRLTSYGRGGGCACKLSQEELARLLSELPTAIDQRLVVGHDTGDDATIFRLPSGDLLVHTADFFTPVVDDPYTWGRVAAANALSDVYAMGGIPLTALNLLCWPRDTLPLDLAAAVLRGAADVAASAGCVLSGGHSVDDAEPKFGLAVTGIVAADELLTNDAGRPGDPLVLTKPLGTGVLLALHKRTGRPVHAAVESMVALNDAASAAARAAGARCATDITGFGLLGHLAKVAHASGVTAVVRAADVPFLPGAEDAVRAGFVSGGTRRNLDWARTRTRFDGCDEPMALLLADAQTSGGLLVAADVPGARIGEFIERVDVDVVVQ